MFRQTCFVIRLDVLRLVTVNNEYSCRSIIYVPLFVRYVPTGEESEKRKKKKRKKKKKKKRERERENRRTHRERMREREKGRGRERSKR